MADDQGRDVRSEDAEMDPRLRIPASDELRMLREEKVAHRRTSALLQNILDTTPTSIFWKDADRRFLGANRAFLDFYGFESDAAIIGRNDEDMGWHPDPGPYRDDELRVIEEGVSTSRVPGRCMVGDENRYIVASKSPMYEDGRVVGLVGSFEDVTEETLHMQEIDRLNDELKVALDEAEKASMAESQFLSSMSHDMRTPLNGIIGFTTLALGTDDDARRQDYLEKIDASGKLMLDLVNDVLDLSKIASGRMTLHPEVFRAAELFGDVLSSVRMLAQQRQVELITDVDGVDELYLNADRLRVQQVLLNLLSNAVKFTPAGGHVWFEVRAVHGERSGLDLVVRDDGVGMSEDFLPHIFEPFSQERNSRLVEMQGTGLGLAIVKRVVDLAMGTIEVESHLEQGTTFHLLLPLEFSEDGPVMSHGSWKDTDLAGRRFLICEDNDLNAEIATILLSERGAAVECARDGRAGLEMFEAAEAGHFDAILMDVRMPLMDGLATTRAIRALPRPDARDIPIIAMTADAYAEDRQRCLEAGMDDHVSKPLEPEHLMAVLAQHLA